MVVLTFLLSETVIIAYQNNSFMNATNSSNINTSPITSTTNISDLSSFINVSSNLTENTSVEPSTNESLTETVEIVDNSNGTSETGANSQNTSINETFSNETTEANFTGNETNSTDFNETVDLNITSNESNATIGTNITLNETNITSNGTLEENETSIEPVIEPVKPIFDVKLAYPQKITRGKMIKISAELTSDSFARNVYLKWVLPQGMEIVSGNKIETCGDLNSSTCTSEIGVKTDLSVIGLNEIKVVVNYEK